MTRLFRTLTVLLVAFGAVGVVSVRGQQRVGEYMHEYNREEVMRRAQVREATESLGVGPFDAGMGRRRRDSLGNYPVIIRPTDDWLRQQEKMLRPEKADREAFSTFLRQPETGLAWLFNDEGIVSDKVVRVKQLGGDRARLIPGGGSFYSFTKQNHSPGKWADVMLQGDRFVVGFAHQALGVLTAVGDVPLESVTADSPAVSVLAKYEPPTAYEQGRRERARLKAGFSVGGNLYRATLPIQVNTTYALRSVAFDRADTLVAFRVVRQESDGSVLLLWKRLQKFPKPKLTGAPRQ